MCAVCKPLLLSVESVFKVFALESSHAENNVQIFLVVTMNAREVFTPDDQFHVSNGFILIYSFFYNIALMAPSPS